MSSLVHWLHIYEKPAVASAGSDQFITRIPMQQYRHSIAAMGGFDTASAILPVDRYQGEQVLNNYIGNRVAIYAANPSVPIWEGIISRVTLSAGSVELSRTLDGMANRVAVLWTDGASGAVYSAETTDDDSIAEYGSIMQVFDVGEMYTNSASFANALRALRVAELGNPILSVFPVPQPDFGVYVEMIGFYHTLMWDANEVVTDTDDTNIMTRYLTDAANPEYSYNDDIFYDYSDTSDIAAGSITANTQRRLGETTWDLALRYAEGGISGDRAVVGISPTDINTGLRRAYYRLANKNVEYVINAYGDGRVRDIRGAIVPPYEMQPDRSIRINNLSLGDALTGYITRVEYDADTQEVTWYTDNVPTMAGVLNVRVNIVSPATNRVQKARRAY